VNTCTPDLPVTEEIIKRLLRFRAEIHLIVAALKLAATIVPKIKCLEVLEL
jgi:hypothetical protein